VTPPDLVVLGNLLVDDVVFPDGRTRMGQPGGAVLYFALGASLSGLQTGIVSLRGSDYPAWALDALAARGVDLAGIHDLGRPGGRAWLLYEGRRRQIVHWMDRPTHAEVSPTAAHVPPAWAAARAFHIAPMPFEVQEALVEDLSRRPDVFGSVDPWLVLRPDTLDPWRRLLDQVDAFFLSEDEMEVGREDPVAALRGLAGGRLRYVIFKRGERGGLLCDLREDLCVEWAARAEAVVDPTGAGDAFAAGTLAGLLEGDAPEAALSRGVVAASFALSAWGPDALFDGSRDLAAARRREWYGA
jgi:sugar/nucleoside kinase (ribokinase family)